MTRKRFIKRLMGMGYIRDSALGVARFWHDTMEMSYADSWASLTHGVERFEYVRRGKLKDYTIIWACNSAPEQVK